MAQVEPYRSGVAVAAVAGVAKIEGRSRSGSAGKVGVNRFYSRAYSEVDLASPAKFRAEIHSVDSASGN